MIMKKIIQRDGEILTTEFNEKFLEMYRALAISVFKSYFKDRILTEDDKQDLDLVILEAFMSYNEKNKFSTWVTWQVKGYCSARIAKTQAAKRNQGYQILSFDYILDRNTKMELLNEDFYTVTESDVNIERDYVDSELLSYISSKLNDVEKKLLAVNLKELRAIDLANELGTSRQNINNLNKRFKRRLTALINEFNR